MVLGSVGRARACLRALDLQVPVTVTSGHDEREVSARFADLGPSSEVMLGACQKCRASVSTEPPLGIEELATGLIMDEAGRTIWPGCGPKDISFDAHRRLAVCASGDGQSLLLLASAGPERIHYRVIDCTDVLECTVAGGGTATQAVTNTQTTTTTRSHLSGRGAVVGGVLLGPAGAMMGGVGYGRPQSHAESVGSIQAVSRSFEGSTVRVTINDPKEPYFSIDLPNAAAATDLSSRMTVVAERGKRRTREVEMSPAIDPLALPDAIMKLVSLKEQGYLTPDQFEEQKSRLLGGTRTDQTSGSMTSEWLTWDSAKAHPSS